MAGWQTALRARFTRLGQARREDPFGFWVRAAGVALLVACLVRVLDDPPWSSGIAERLAEGKHLRPKDWATTWGWWAALVNGAGLGALLLTSRRWLTDRRVPGVGEAPPAGPGVGFRIGVLVALALTVWLAAPRLSQSFWDDEAYGMRHFVYGSWVHRERDEPRFARPRLRDTMYDYRKPNNHVPANLLTRFSIAAWEVFDPSENGLANEVAARIPALLAGLGSTAALAWLLWRMGFPSAGVLAAFLLALHPWHLRYLSEARGYALLMALQSLALIQVLRVFERGSWRRWAGFGALQFAILWTYPGAGFLLLVLNLCVAGGLLWQYRGQDTLAGQLARQVVCVAAAAMLWLQLMLPNLAQLRDYVDDEKVIGAMGSAWWETVGSLLFSGMAWSHRDPLPVHPQLSEVAASQPILFWSALVGAGLLTVLGAARLLRAGGVRALLLPVLLLPAPLTWAVAEAAGTQLKHWYVVFWVPPLVGLVALGASAVFARAGSPRVSAGLSAVFMLGIALGYAQLTRAPRDALRSLPITPRRESVELSRGVLDPVATLKSGPLVASFYAAPRYYDPYVLRFTSREELDGLIARAEREGRPLLLNIGRMELIAKRLPHTLEWIAPGGGFELVERLHGFEPRMDRFVYRWTGTPHARKAAGKAGG